MTEKIIALATCYNRCSLTIKALKSIVSQKIPMNCNIDICIVDDGSIDNTSTLIKEQFSEVKVLQGDGNLYWAGGMRFGWNNFVKTQSFDYILVFNDDINLYPSAIENLIDTARSIEQQGQNKYVVVGAFKDTQSNNTAYSCVVRRNFWHPLQFRRLDPSESIQYGDTLNMNLALISREAINQIGFFSEEFTHAKADFDFGLRLKSQGGIIALAPNYVGECTSNPLRRFSYDPNLSAQVKWQKLVSVKQEPLKERAIYYRRHGGIFWIIFCILPYVRIGIELCIEKLIYFVKNFWSKLVKVSP